MSIPSTTLSLSLSLSLVCGDGRCSGDIGETCDSCAVDCCPALPVGDAVGISFGVIVFISVFIVSSIFVAVSAVSTSYYYLK